MVIEGPDSVVEGPLQGIDRVVVSYRREEERCKSRFRKGPGVPGSTSPGTGGEAGVDEEREVSPVFPDPTRND